MVYFCFCVNRITSRRSDCFSIFCVNMLAMSPGIVTGVIESDAPVAEIVADGKAGVGGMGFDVAVVVEEFGVVSGIIVGNVFVGVG